MLSLLHWLTSYWLFVLSAARGDCWAAVDVQSGHDEKLSPGGGGGIVGGVGGLATQGIKPLSAPTPHPPSLPTVIKDNILC